MVSLFHDGTWQSPTRSAAIYRVATPPATPAFLQPILAHFQVPPPNEKDWEDGPATLLLERSPHTFVYYKPSGALCYTDKDRWQVEKGQVSPALTDEKAIEVAVLCIMVLVLGLLIAPSARHYR